MYLVRSTKPAIPIFYAYLSHFCARLCRDVTFPGKWKNYFALHFFCLKRVLSFLCAHPAFCMLTVSANNSSHHGHHAGLRSHLKARCPGSLGGDWINETCTSLHALQRNALITHFLINSVRRIVYICVKATIRLIIKPLLENKNDLLLPTRSFTTLLCISQIGAPENMLPPLPKLSYRFSMTALPIAVALSLQPFCQVFAISLSLKCPSPCRGLCFILRTSVRHCLLLQVNSFSILAPHIRPAHFLFSLPPDSSGLSENRVQDTKTNRHLHHSR